MHIHIAILDLDVPVPTVYATRGLYSSQFTHLLVSAAARLSQSQSLSPGKEITISTSSYDVVGGIFPSPHLLRERGGIDGILLTGSSTSVYHADKHPWISSLQAFLTEVYVNHPHIKLFGSCFGHQMLARTLVPGCAVEACPGGYEIGVHAIALEENFVKRFGFSLLPSLPEAQGTGKKEMKLQFIHGDWVVCEAGLPDDWVNVGSTPRCPIQGLYRRGRVLTFQGHFEFDVFVNRETCLEFGTRWGWDAEVVEGYVRAIEAGNGKDDAEVAAAMVIWFFAGEDMKAACFGQNEVKMMEGGLLTPPLE
ncbi:putative glutamine amidotransferase-like protein C13C5.04 [Aspergillus lentulus]|nr:putative glutamine amidotransferase-like protein C13C5.04 [Aspergillus lentulus]